MSRKQNDRDPFIWKTGTLTNEKIGSLFGMTYSSTSHIVRSIKHRLEQDSRLKEKFNQIYSQFNIMTPIRSFFCAFVILCFRDVDMQKLAEIAGKDMRLD